MLMLLAAALSIVAAPGPNPSPWDGDWVLDAARSSPVAKEGAADGYRFHIVGDSIRWEIPSLGEVVTGHLDGRPMVIHREREKSPGLTLSVRAEGPGVLVYTVKSNGKAEGGGRMTLIDGGKAWIDLTRAAGSAMWGAAVTYVKR